MWALWGKAKLVHEKEKRGEEKFRAVVVVVAILLVVLLLVRLLALSKALRVGCL